MGGSIPVSISLPISLPISLALALVLVLALALERLHILMEPSLLDNDVATPGFFFFIIIVWVFGFLVLEQLSRNFLHTKIVGAG